MAGKYDREFKLEAIRLSSEEGARATDVERRLGLSQGIISRWKRQLDSEGADAFPGKGHLSVPDEQVRHLQRENERLCRERDILKKHWPSSRRGGSGSLSLYFGAPHAVACWGDVPCIGGVSQWFLCLAKTRS